LNDLCGKYTDAQAYIKPQPKASCAPATDPAPAITPPTWTTYAQLCGGQPTVCDQDTLCVPTAGAASICIYREGDFDCPLSSGYTAKQLFFGGATDNRTCACSCTASGSIGCSGNLTSGASPQKCTGTTACNQGCCPTNVYMGFTSTTTGTCQAVASEAGMGPEPSDPVTVCCLP
jgi:hypothetical protein